MSVKLRLIQPMFLAGVCLIALSPITAAASQTYYEKVAGFETGVPVPCTGGSASSFIGSASGTLNGTFQATICHTNLDPSKVPAGLINPGGSFVLSGQSTTINGQFTGGTVLFVTADHFGTFCYQLFFVHGTLGPLGTATTPTGDFRTWLTHYGSWDGATCNVRFATVAGNATITA